MDDLYYKKYLKYKTKYFELKNQMMGGSRSNIIIHISGPSGSGKTHLGNKLKEIYGNKIIVKDLDDIRDKFIRDFYGESTWTDFDQDSYKTFVKKVIMNSLKPIIITGLNMFPHSNKYYDLNPTHKFYIKLTNEQILEQKCLRLFKNVSNDKGALSDLLNQNESFVRIIKRGIDDECNMKNIIKMNNKWNKHYQKQKYIFIERDELLQHIIKILDNAL